MATASETLRACALYAGLPDADLGILESSGAPIAFAPGDVFWRPGERAIGFTVVVSGILKLTHALPNGRDALLSVFGPTESIGDVAAINDMPYPAQSVAVTSGVLLKMPCEVVRAVASGNAQLRRRFELAPLAHLQRLQGKVATLHAGEIDARLAHALIDLAARLGRRRDDGSWLVPTPLSRQDLADLVSARIESVIRTMSRWSKDGLVETRPTGFVILEYGELAKLAGHAPSA